MGWETRVRGGHYYCRSRKVRGRVIREYIGRGTLAERVANRDAARRAERAAESAARSIERTTRETADTPLAAFDGILDGLTVTALTRAGYHRHHRGEWRRRRWKEDPMNGIEPVQVGTVLDQAALEVLVRAAAGGDERALTEVTRMFDGVQGAWDVVADLGLRAERAWVDLVASTTGDDPLFRRALERRLTALRREVEGPVPSALERLLAERVTVNWLAVQFADEEVARCFRGGGNLAHASFHQDRLDRAQRRLMAAVKALAQVRRLLGPAVQINIGEQQVNVAG